MTNVIVSVCMDRKDKRTIRLLQKSTTIDFSKVCCIEQAVPGYFWQTIRTLKWKRIAKNKVWEYKILA